MKHLLVLTMIMVVSTIAMAGKSDMDVTVSLASAISEAGQLSSQPVMSVDSVIEIKDIKGQSLRIAFLVAKEIFWLAIPPDHRQLARFQALKEGEKIGFDLTPDPQSENWKLPVAWMIFRITETERANKLWPAGRFGRQVSQYVSRVTEAGLIAQHQWKLKGMSIDENFLTLILTDDTDEMALDVDLDHKQIEKFKNLRLGQLVSFQPSVKPLAYACASSVSAWIQLKE